MESPQSRLRISRGKALRDARKTHGFSAQKLLRLACEVIEEPDRISVDSIYSYETGRVLLPRHLAKVFAEILEVGLDELLCSETVDLQNSDTVQNWGFEVTGGISYSGSTDVSILKWDLRRNEQANRVFVFAEGTATPSTFDLEFFDGSIEEKIDDVTSINRQIFNDIRLFDQSQSSFSGESFERFVTLRPTLKFGTVDLRKSSDTIIKVFVKVNSTNESELIRDFRWVLHVKPAEIFVTSEGGACPSWLNIYAENSMLKTELQKQNATGAINISKKFLKKTPLVGVANIGITFFEWFGSR